MRKMELLDLPAKVDWVLNHIEKTGESIVITDNGKPIVKLVPCRSVQGDPPASKSSALRKKKLKSR